MKQVLKAFAFVAVIMTSFAANAQKIAHIDMQTLFYMMPERTAAMAELQTVQQTLQQTSDGLIAEFQMKQNDLEMNQSTWSALVVEDKYTELRQLETRIKTFNQNAQSQLQQKEAELTQPIYEKAIKACEEVAKANGYDYVMDSSSFIVSPDAYDIMDLVKAHLGITIPTPTPEQMQQQMMQQAQGVY